MSVFQDTFDDWLMVDTELTYDEWLQEREDARLLIRRAVRDDLTFPEHTGAIPRHLAIGHDLPRV